MTRLKAILSIFLAVALCPAAAPLAADGGGGQTGPIVETHVGSTKIVWEVLGEFGDAVLLFSAPDGNLHRETYRAGDTPVLSLFNIEFELCDGNYSWELRFAQRGELQERDLGADKYPALFGKRTFAATIAGGTVGILNGKLVRPESGDERTPGKGRFEVEGDDGIDLGGNGLVQPKDFVINDDLIVDGSACIGFDCVNGEVFNFDTIRLKENNLRIKFDDTSVAASFPRNDWQLTANDSANGGASKFSIEDISNGRTPFTVEASAPSHSLYVDDGGRLGLGTSTPVVDVHVISGDTPTLRLEQTSSSGFAPQTWDVAGNEVSFFVRDATGGSTLPFRIRPGAPSSSVYIDVTGDVGFGTSSPTSEIDVLVSAGENADLEFGDNDQTWKLRANGGNDQFNVVNDTASTTPLRIAAASNTNLLQLGVNAANRIDITGALFINGVDNSTPDYVFGPDYELESIAEHASFMWQNRHLPALAPAATGEDGKAVIDVANRSQGLLEELEKAHIYIEQLHTVIQKMESRLEKLESGD